MKNERFQVEYSDFRGHYVNDIFLVKIVFAGSKSDCNDYATKQNKDFHSKHKLVTKKNRLEIEKV